jgi:type I restriction enzyme, S subunit
MSKYSTAKVRDLCSQVRGVSYPKEEASLTPDDNRIPLLRAGNITDKGISLRDLLYIPERRVKTVQRLQRGDIVVATSSGSRDVVGKTAQVRDGIDATFGAFCKVLRPGPQIESRYIGHYFLTENYRRKIASIANGANINNLRNEDLDGISVPLPPAAEQRRIAAILDRADEIRADRYEAVERLSSLREAIFLEAFGDPALNPKGWPLVQLGTMAESCSYGTSQKASLSGTYPVLRMNNITYQGDIDMTDLKYMQLSADKLDRYTVRDGDILFNRTNSPDLVGKTAVYRGHSSVAFAGYLIRLRTTPANEPDYISAYLNSRYGKALLRNRCKSIIGMANINAQEIQSIKIPSPPSELQEKFAASLKMLAATRSRYCSSLAELDALFASLQARAFAGEL